MDVFQTLTNVLTVQTNKIMGFRILIQMVTLDKLICIIVLVLWRDFSTLPLPKANFHSEKDDVTTVEQITAESRQTVVDQTKQMRTNRQGRLHFSYHKLSLKVKCVLFTLLVSPNGIKTKNTRLLRVIIFYSFIGPAPNSHMPCTLFTLVGGSQKWKSS